MASTSDRPDPGRSGRPVGKPTLLIVDDVPENLLVLYKILRDEYEIVGATSGTEALQLAASSRPDLILLDVMMPELDGYEVCRLLKKDSRNRDVPVIFISALNEEIDEMRGFEVGAVDFVMKPIKPPILLHRVAVHLELQARRQALLSRNEELQAALARVKELSGMLPICMTCKKIRDDEGYWRQLESYISEHSEALFSHCYCPECAEAALKALQRQLGP